jgi:phosphoribosylformylglycinamidine cyclo-ligase
MERGNIPERDMYNTYNMGVGMSVVVGKDKAEEALRVLKEKNEEAYVIGEVVKSDEGVILC